MHSLSFETETEAVSLTIGCTFIAHVTVFRYGNYKNRAVAKKPRSAACFCLHQM